MVRLNLSPAAHQPGDQTITPQSHAYFCRVNANYLFEMITVCVASRSTNERKQYARLLPLRQTHKNEVAKFL